MYVLALSVLVWACSGDRGAERDPLVFAAASLTTVLDAIKTAWDEDTARPVAISYASSSALARQIEEGAPADIFVSADLDWMDYLQARDLIQPATRVDLLGNRIALVAPQDSATTTAIEPEFPLATLLGNGRLAMADTMAAPAGRYGRAALESLGVWDSVSDRIAQAENVRAALALVSRGEAPLGVVYRTDAAADPGVRVVGLFPESTHPPIVYPAALTAMSTHPDAAAFLAFLQSDRARALFEAHGFTVLGPASRD